MRIIERVIDYASRRDTFTIYPLFDIHLGTVMCDEGRLDSVLTEIERDPHALYLLGGDNVDCINARDPRFDPRVLPHWLIERWNRSGDLASSQRAELIERLAKRSGLHGKCIGVMQGNHEAMIYARTETNVYDPLLEALRENDVAIGLGYEGFIVCRFHRTEKGPTWTVVIYVNHGWGGGDLAGGVALKLERVIDRFDADVYLLGHHHRVQSMIQARPLRVNAALSLEEQPDRVGAICGTFMRGRIEGVETYQERKGYRPLPRNGLVLVRITPDKRRIELVERVDI